MHTHKAAHFGLLKNWLVVEIQMLLGMRDRLNIRVSPLDAEQ